MESIRGRCSSLSLCSLYVFFVLLSITLASSIPAPNESGMDIEDEEESVPSLVADLGPGSESRGLDYLPQTLLARYLVQAGYLPAARLRLVQAPLGPLSKRTPKRARDNGKPVMGSEFLDDRDQLMSDTLDHRDLKRYSEFLGGPGKRYSEFLGGPGKRLSEFLGGPGKRFTQSSPGYVLAKKLSEFLGGPGKRYNNYALLRSVVNDDEDSFYSPAGYRVPKGSEFLGGPGR